MSLIFLQYNDEQVKKKKTIKQAEAEMKEERERLRLEYGWKVVKGKRRRASFVVGVFSCTLSRRRTEGAEQSRGPTLDSLKQLSFFILITLHGPLR